MYCKQQATLNCIRNYNSVVAMLQYNVTTLLRQQLLQYYHNSTAISHSTAAYSGRATFDGRDTPQPALSDGFATRHLGSYKRK